jgi:exonuclease SbcD
MVGASRTQRRILHTSDLHLESLANRSCHSLETLVSLANQANVDLVIVAGDLFDHNRVDDSLVRFVVEQLQRLSADVVILPGNHDCLVSGSVYERANLWEKCTNIRVLKGPHGETLDLPDIGISLWGKPMGYYEACAQPLAGIPQPKRNGHWHIAVAHGYYVDGGPPLFPSYNITKEEIVTSNYDYIALGHIVEFRCVHSGSVKAYYCGSPSISGMVAIVDLAEEFGVRVTPYSLMDKQ